MLGSRWRGEALHCEFAWSETNPSIAAVETIGVYEDEVTGVEGGLDAPLYHYLDPEALDALVQSKTPTAIVLRLDEYHVAIHENIVRVSLRKPTTPWTQ